jgi:cell division protein FtsI (penicillin-binding protein 3)
VLNAYNGHWKPKWRKTPIRDDDAFEWLSAENALVYSSNIVMSQLSLRLTNTEFYNGLKKFGFGKLSGVDLPYELKGRIRSLRELNYPVYKSTTSYGYGILVNFMQLLKAYNTFNNDGVEVTPKIADVPTSSKRVMSAKNAREMVRILRKIVLKGTAKAAYIKGIFTAGKTGTAHISVNNKYNSSFFGFANDDNHKYTIGVTFYRIKAPFPKYFASASAVPVFKKIVLILQDENLIGGKGDE